jgi:hypothetical protein
MVEKVTGKSWEKNLMEHVFAPLKLTSAGFGGTGTPGKIDQPWSHTADGQPVPQNGPTVDNPPVMGPPGRVHCTLQDWSKYVADFLRGMAGKPALLPTAAYKTLATPPFGGDYALGWIVTERDWAGGTVLTHSGSNTMNYATVWIAPQRDFAILACTNQGGDAAHAACDAAVVALMKYHTTGETESPATGAVGTTVAPRSEPADGTRNEKKSPFTAVRWQEAQPEVQLDDQWFKLVSINDLPAAEIVAFSQRTFENQWQKRFEEDLVELLSRMGHPPQDKVILEVQSLTSGETQVRKGVPMTEANRQAIKAAAAAREKIEPRAASPVVKVTPEVLAKYEGVYAITPQFALTVTREGTKLMVQATGQQKFEVYPESETKFFYKVVDAQLTFVGDKNGQAEMLILHQNGANQVATRQD